LATERKYRGLLPTPLIKIIRAIVLAVTTYIQGAVPAFNAMHSIMSVLRLIQLFAPCLVSGSTTFWTEGSVVYSAIHYVTSAAFFVPAGFRRQLSVIMELVSTAIIVSFVVCLSLSAFMYLKTSTLPRFLAITVVLMAGTVVFLIPGPGLYASFQTIGTVIAGGELKFPLPLEVVGVVLVLGVTGLMFWYVTNVSAVSLVFQPISLMTMLPRPSSHIFVANNVIISVVAMAGSLNQIGRIIMTLVGAGCYIYTSTIPFMAGSFVSVMQQRFVFTECVTGALFMVLVAMYDLLGRRAAEIEVLAAVEFSSRRKCSSVVIRHPKTGRTVLFCKGADDVLFERLAADSAFRPETHTNLMQFASDGLRTMCCAWREIDERFYEEWNRRFRQVSCAL